MKWTTYFLSFVIIFMSSMLYAEKEEVHKDDKGRTYHLYLPNKIEKNKKYWLFVAVHGAGGNGAGGCGYAKWADRGDCIVLSPSFPDGYQGLQHETADQLLNIFKDLKKKYSLREKMFLYGFSGGSQFVHRFAIMNPTVVCGVAAHSGGSWATGPNYIEMPKQPLPFPIAISCGLSDTGFAWKGAPMNRLEWCMEFEKQLKERNCLYKVVYFPKTGHQITKETRALTEDCFLFATTGLSVADRKLLESKFNKLEKLAFKNENRFDQLTETKQLKKTKLNKSAPNGWNDNQKIREQVYFYSIDSLVPGK